MTPNNSAIDATNIFIPYQKDEDQLTKAFLHCAHEGGYDFLHSFCEFIGISTPKSPLQIYTQKAIKTNESNNIADGILTVSPLELIIESKLGAPKDKKQHEKLLKYIKHQQKKGINAYLLYITQDVIKPKILSPETYWISWDETDKWLETFAEKHVHLKMLSKAFHGLYLHLTNVFNGINPDELTVIIPVGKSHEFDNSNNIYHCPASRSFRGAKYMAFYYDQAIRDVYKIDKNIEVNNGQFEDIPENDQIFILSRFDDIISEPIKNNKLSKDGLKTTAFTQRHRYCSLNELKGIKTTSELEDRMQKRIDQFKK